jgi:hypothetical protein
MREAISQKRYSFDMQLKCEWRRWTKTCSQVILHNKPFHFPYRAQSVCSHLCNLYFRSRPQDQCDRDGHYLFLLYSGSPSATMCCKSPLVNECCCIYCVSQGGKYPDIPRPSQLSAMMNEVIDRQPTNPCYLKRVGVIPIPRPPLSNIVSPSTSPPSFISPSIPLEILQLHTFWRLFYLSFHSSWEERQTTAIHLPWNIPTSINTSLPATAA